LEKKKTAPPTGVMGDQKLTEVACKESVPLEQEGKSRKRQGKLKNEYIRMTHGICALTQVPVKGRSVA